MTKLIIAGFSIFPLLSLVLSILLFRVDVLRSALIAIIVALFIAFFLPDYHITLQNAHAAISSTAILSISAIIIIIPGVYLNLVLTQSGQLHFMVNWFERLAFNNIDKVIILLIGFIPVVESFTGFGVSLFISFPILISFLSREKALKIALLGMNIMPWGTLALATIVGASIIHHPINLLGEKTSLISMLVFPYLTIISIFTIEQKIPLIHMLKGVILSVIFSITLWINNRFFYVETAGIVSGSVIISISYLSLYKEKTKRINCWEFLTIFYPYLFILFLVALTKFVPKVNYFLEHLVVIKTDDLSLSLFSNPGWILLITALIIQASKFRTHFLLWASVKHSQRSCYTLTCFLLLSQLMNASHMMAKISSVLSKYINTVSVHFIVPFIGVLSGYLTGSNTGGNGLSIGLQNHLGQYCHKGLLASALQNSAAGHAVFASLPVIVLLLTIANINECRFDKNEQIFLVRYTLKVLLGVYCMIVMSSFLWF